MKSEFGKGLCYNLGLFLAHEERYMKYKIDFEKIRITNKDKRSQDYFSEGYAVEMWFNGASDHLYELQYSYAPKKLRKRIQTFQQKCLLFGHGFLKKKPTEKEYKWAIQEAKELLLLIDKANKVPVIKGDFE